jgi:hypothetical protein
LAAAETVGDQDRVRAANEAIDRLVVDARERIEVARREEASRISKAFASGVRGRPLQRERSASARMDEVLLTLSGRIPPGRRFR